MKGSWPKVIASVERRIVAYHSLPDIGIADRHSHDYLIRAGWRQEINPHFGHTKSMQDMRKDLDALLNQLEGKYLNEVFQFPPTAETMACWIMARLPAYFGFVEIECYEGYFVRVEADSMRSEWAEEYRK